MAALERLMRLVEPEPMSGCWIFLGKWTKRGYGQFYFNDRTMNAHRAALSLKLGRTLLPHEDSCHTCDVPPCVAFNHLFAGTRADNMRDAAAKGRIRGPWSARRALEVTR